MDTETVVCLVKSCMFVFMTSLTDAFINCSGINGVTTSVHIACKQIHKHLHRQRHKPPETSYLFSLCVQGRLTPYLNPLSLYRKQTALLFP